MANYDDKFLRIGVLSYESRSPFFTGLVYCNDTSYEDYSSRMSFSILKTEKWNKEDGFAREYVLGDYINKDNTDIVVFEEIDKAHPLYNECCELYKEFQKIHEAPYIVSCSIVPEYADDNVHDIYGSIENRTFEIPSKDVAEFPADIERWLLANHPDYFMGYGAQQDCVSGNFICSCVIGPYTYEKGTFETFENRRAFAATIAEKLGVTLGPVEHDYEKLSKMGSVEEGKLIDLLRSECSSCLYQLNFKDDFIDTFPSFEVESISRTGDDSYKWCSSYFSSYDVEKLLNDEGVTSLADIDKEKFSDWLFEKFSDTKVYQDVKIDGNRVKCMNPSSHINSLAGIDNFRTEGGSENSHRFTNFDDLASVTFNHLAELSKDRTTRDDV